MGARREVLSAVAERYRSAKRAEKGRILDELCATTGWHRKHAVRALRQRKTVAPGEFVAVRDRSRRYGTTTKDALTALWEASDRVCGKRLKVMIPTLLPALEQHGRLQLGKADRDCVLAISPATIDRLLGDVKLTASGGKRRRAGFYSAIRREVPIRTFNDWKGPPPGFCEVDMVAHGGTSVAGSFIQTLTMVDVATGCLDPDHVRCYPRGRAAAAGEAAVDNDVVALRHNELVFVTQSVGRAANKTEQAIAAWLDMSTVLDVSF